MRDDDDRNQRNDGADDAATAGSPITEDPTPEEEHRRGRARMVAMWRAAVAGVAAVADADEAIDPAANDSRVPGETATWLFPPSSEHSNGN